MDKVVGRRGDVKESIMATGPGDRRFALSRRPSWSAAELVVAVEK